MAKPNLKASADVLNILGNLLAMGANGWKYEAAYWAKIEIVTE